MTEVDINGAGDVKITGIRPEADETPKVEMERSPDEPEVEQTDDEKSDEADKDK